MESPFRLKQNTALAAGAAVMIAATLSSPEALGQGCVIARGSGVSMITEGEGLLEAGQWQATLGYRWLNSFRHFLGGVEQTQRIDQDTQVENDSHFFDLTGTYAVSKRFWVNLTLPFSFSDRSSLYEHDRVNRYSTQAGGLGDVRLTTTYWLINPETYHDGNIAFGAGVKLPTGDYEATDVFHKVAGPTIGYVDSSIQPGDGGFGVVLDLQGYHKIYQELSAYMNMNYLINPREKVNSTGFSVPDSYLFRLGLNYNLPWVHGLAVSLGGRMEGVPSTDWVGGDSGFRRPGYTVAIEPGVSYIYKKFFCSISTPVALERNREKNYLGRPGDAAFADYTINTSFGWRF